MIVALIAAIALAALLGGLNVAQLVQSRGLLSRAEASDASGLATSKLLLVAEADRDRANARASQAEAERDIASAQLATTVRMANAEREETNRRVQKLLDSGTAADAAGFLSTLLLSPLPGVATGPAVAAGADPDHPVKT